MEQPGKPPLICSPSYTVLDNDDLLITCSIATRILFVRVGADDGKAAHAYAAMADCPGGYRAALFPLRRPDGSVWLIGSLPPGGTGTGLYMDGVRVDALVTLEWTC